MSDKRQKNQLMLAFMDESRGEAPRVSTEGTESPVVKRGTESLASGEQLMEEVCGRENCKQALARVKANKGSAGVDGMTVNDLPEFLKQHWPAIREQLLSGTYKPEPMKRVEIPKPDGGVRKHCLFGWPRDTVKRCFGFSAHFTDHLKPPGINHGARCCNFRLSSQN